MKTVAIRLGVVLLAFMLACTWAMAQASDVAERALAGYTQGKNRYDAGDFSGARDKFEEAISIEPANPRWHYNLGLAFRQLNNFPAAQQSLLKSLALDPNYKRAEIEDKLASMGFHPTGSAVAGDSGFGFIESFAVLAGAGGCLWLLVRGVRAKRGDTAVLASPNAALVAKATTRLDKVAGQLVQVEHAMRLGEHPDLRSQLDHATQLERSAQKQIDLMRQGDAKALRRIDLALEELERSAGRAQDIAVASFGAQAFAGQGDRVACYFCAKPLANLHYRQGVAMKQADVVVNVMSCPQCASVAAQGRSPQVLTGADGRTHWSELPSFDPYTARHAVNAQTARTPGWKFTQQRSMAELGLIAGGSALAGGAMAAMLSPDVQAAGALLDLDMARENALAQEAATASARHAAGQRREQFSDHS
jgi:tetratricopeptide (TPR) repeat protein